MNLTRRGQLCGRCVSDGLKSRHMLAINFGGAAAFGHLCGVLVDAVYAVFKMQMRARRDPR